jgi:hypothetical protein
VLDVLKGEAMEATHTPGPWTAGCDRDDIDESNVVLAGDVVIAHVVDAPEIRERHNRGRVEGPGSSAASDSLDEADANARMMAAAPAMAQAIRNAIPMMKLAWKEYGVGGMFECMDEMRAALSSAGVQL